MVTKTIAGSPVGDVILNPVSEGVYVFRLEPVFEVRDPGGYNKSFLQMS